MNFYFSFPLIGGSVWRFGGVPGVVFPFTLYKSQGFNPQTTNPSLQSRRPGTSCLINQFVQTWHPVRKTTCRSHCRSKADWRSKNRTTDWGSNSSTTQSGGSKEITSYPSWGKKTHTHKHTANLRTTMSQDLERVFMRMRAAGRKTGEALGAVF